MPDRAAAPRQPAAVAGRRPYPAHDASPPPRRLSVWAPRAHTLDLVLPAEDRVVPMTAEPDGWWSADALPHGTDYAFRLDGKEPALPDPRTAWQPAGVHGPSRAFDPNPGRPGPWRGVDARGAVIYELHIGTFTAEGTLDAAAGRLDHLVELGVDVVELMPVAAFPGRHGWGYDGVDDYAVQDAYGGPAALQRFVAAAHDRGVGVCLDVVYNHPGPSGNYLNRFGPYFTDRHANVWGDGINLDGPDAGPVRAFVVENAIRWCEDFGIDALRLDAIHAIVDDSPRHVLAEMADEIDALAARLGRPLTLVAESDLNQAQVITPTSEGGLGMHAQWADDVHHALHALMTGERQGYYVDFGSLEVLEHALTRVFVHDGTYSTFRGETWGAPVPDDVDGHAFVVFAQNHDQVGNRGLGDRPSRVLTDGQLAIEAALVLTSHFTPMLFMGEEWGARTPWQFFTDHSEPELAEGIREGRAKEFAEFGWEEMYGGEVVVPDPQSPATVAASTLDWTEAGRPEGARLLTFYRRLIALRRAEPDLASGDRSATRCRHDDTERWLVVERGRLAVVVNLAPEPAAVPVPGAGARPVLLTWEPVTPVGDEVRMAGHGVAVLGPATDPA
jgi:maltooligosyltrehalose trehalohydrolase